MSRAGPAAVAGALLLALSVTAPARLVAHFLPPEQVRAQGFSGSLWSGAAASVAVSLNGSWLQLGALRWELAPLSLLLLSPRVKLESEWGRQRFEADISRSPGGDLRLRDAGAGFSADLVKRWLPVQLGGALDLAVRDLRLRDGIPREGRGRLVWREAFWVGDRGGRALGNYLLEFSVPGERRLSGTISTLSGPVTVEGVLVLTGGEYTVDVRLASERGFGADIGSALQLVAVPTGDGYRLKFSSEITPRAGRSRTY